MPAEAEKFSKKLRAIDELVVKDDLNKFLKFIMDFTVSLKKANTETIQTLQNTFNNFINKLKEDNNEFVEDIKKKVDIKLASVKDGEKGERGTDGRDADTAEVALEASKLAQEAIKSLIPSISSITDELPKLGQEIAGALELLPEEEKLEISAIKNLEKRLDELKKVRMQLGGGGGGFSKMAMDIHLVDDEMPTGTVNGTNKDFVLNHTPSPTASLKVYVNGQRMRITEDYTLSTKTISFTVAPPTGSVILTDYRI